jgi:hypothetical protein
VILPRRSAPVGIFHWDVLPGFYAVNATHNGCTASKGPSKTGTTGVLPVPPPQLNLSITMRCPKLKRAATRLKLKVVSRYRAGALVEGLLSRRRGRRLPASRLPGTVRFTAHGKKLPPIAVDTAKARVLLVVPVTKPAIKSLSARFTGNGFLAPASARIRWR